MKRPDLEVEAWRRTMPQVDSLIKVDKVAKGLILIVLGLMISMGVLNTSLMSVIERRREFGVMLALGLSPLRNSSAWSSRNPRSRPCWAWAAES